MTQSYRKVIYNDSIIRLISFTIIESYYEEFPLKQLNSEMVSYIENRLALKLWGLPSHLAIVFHFLTLACTVWLFIKSLKFSNFSYIDRSSFVKSLKNSRLTAFRGYILFIEKFTALYLAEWHEVNK